VQSPNAGFRPQKVLWLGGRFGKQSTGMAAGSERQTTVRRHGRGWNRRDRTGTMRHVKQRCEQILYHGDNWTRLTHWWPLRNDRLTNRTQENGRQRYWNHEPKHIDKTPIEVRATISITRTTPTSNLTTTLPQRTRQADLEAWRSYRYTLRPSWLWWNAGIRCHFHSVQVRLSFLALTWRRSSTSMRGLPPLPVPTPPALMPLRCSHPTVWNAPMFKTLLS